MNPYDPVTPKDRPLLTVVLWLVLVGFPLSLLFTWLFTR